YANGNYEEAVACYSRCIELDSENHLGYANRGMAYLKLNRYREAELDCSKALEKNPKFLKALHRRTIARKNQGKIAAALRDADQMAKLAPTNGSAILLLRQLKSASKKLREAEKSRESSGTNGKLDGFTRLKIVEHDGDSSGEEETVE
ncbi:hypothetical protein AAMO2058_001012900, partial [Amorphochlora amoebiformis]